MLYRTANNTLKQLGESAGYRHPIHYYCFRRWVANEANHKFLSKDLKDKNTSVLQEIQRTIIVNQPLLRFENTCLALSKFSSLPTTG